MLNVYLAKLLEEEEWDFKIGGRNKRARLMAVSSPPFLEYMLLLRVSLTLNLEKVAF